MKNYSTTPLPDVAVKWKDGEWAHYINHKDNGVQPAGEEGKRYEADFTILRSQSIEEVIRAFTRFSQDTDLDYAVVNNIEVDRTKAIEVERDYQLKVTASIFPALPSVGSLKKGQVYSYGNGAVMVVQDHERTIYPPELTPALFTFHREITDGQPWIPQESIALGATRSFDGKMYECIQAHTSLSTWTPDVAPALWKEVTIAEEYKTWSAADHWTTYTLGDKRIDAGKLWECINVGFSYYQPSSANGKYGWKYLKDI